VSFLELYSRNIVDFIGLYNFLSFSFDLILHIQISIRCKQLSILRVYSRILHKYFLLFSILYYLKIFIKKDRSLEKMIFIKNVIFHSSIYTLFTDPFTYSSNYKVISRIINRFTTSANVYTSGTELS